MSITVTQSSRRTFSGVEIAGSKALGDPNLLFLEHRQLWFRIIDYTGATRLLDQHWDRPPTIEVSASATPHTATLVGTVLQAGQRTPIVGASVAVQAGPNDQRGPVLSNENGQFRFGELPVGEVTLIANGPRAAAILLFAEGKSLADIAGSYPEPKNHETIRRWSRRYRSEGIAGLETKPGQGRQPRNTAESSAAEIPQ